MNAKIALLFSFTLMLQAGTVSACQYDSDCDIDASCMIEIGETFGACIGGIDGPGNAHDTNPIPRNLRQGDTLGKSCDYDSQCASRECKLDEYGYGTCF